MKHGKAMVLILAGALLFLMVAVLPFWLLAGDMQDGYRGETPFGHAYYAPELGTSATLHGAGSITFSFRQEQPQTLRVLENDQERLLPLEEGKGYVIALPNQTGNITYRIPYRDGEYILHITCQGK